MIDIHLILLPLFGLIIGLLVSMFGGGGGGFFAPVLILIFGVTPQVAVAASLASVLPTSVVSTFSHFRQGNVDFRTGLILGIGGIIGTLIGASIANIIPPTLLQKILGIFTLIMLIPMLKSLVQRHQKLKEKNDDKTGTLPLTGPKRIIASFFGVVSGLLAGIFGISGTPPIVAGLYSLGLPAAMVVGTSVFVLIFNSIAGIGGFYLLGRLDLTLIILLGGGAAVGAFIGPLLLKKINPKTFEKIYGPVIVGIMVIFGLGLLLT
ncbi:MAG TPA: sulfite exporter TauE/SafE family protein [Methanobacterium sp.]|nr:sulfite exporter TauE/SafE family protein [Methanobacterium sp.]